MTSAFSVGLGARAATERGTSVIVDVNEIERCLRYFKAINNADLEDIVWMRGNEQLHADPAALEEFSFTGLSNRDFPAVVGWLPEGVGIRVVGLAITKAPNAEVTGSPALSASPRGLTGYAPHTED